MGQRIKVTKARLISAEELPRWTPEHGAPWPGGIVEITSLQDVREFDRLFVNGYQFYVRYAPIHSFNIKLSDPRPVTSTVKYEWILSPTRADQKTGYMPLSALPYFLNCGFHLTRCGKDGETMAETEAKHKRWEIERLQNGERWDILSSDDQVEAKA